MILITHVRGTVNNTTTLSIIIVCHYAECYFAECRNAVSLYPVNPSYIMSYGRKKYLLISHKHQLTALLACHSAIYLH